MSDEEIIWKAIDQNGNKLIGKGTSIFNKLTLNNILSIYQNQYKSIILELYDKDCTERIGFLSSKKKDLQI